jgi:hypothetical protein
MIGSESNEAPFRQCVGFSLLHFRRNQFRLRSGIRERPVERKLDTPRKFRFFEKVKQAIDLPIAKTYAREEVLWR